MASAAMASSNDSGTPVAMVVNVIDCAAAVDAAAAILLSLLTAAAIMPLLPLPLAVAAIDNGGKGGCQQQQ